MANKFKFNPNYSESNSLFRNGWAIDVTAQNTGGGPSEITGLYNGANIPNGGWVVYLTGTAFTATSDIELQDFVSSKGGDGSTLNSALTWINDQSDMIVVNRNYENIVTDGLVLNLDAGFTPSYPTTGNTWYDLSRESNNGTLTNGPTFNSNGWIDFDGVNDWCNIPNTNLVPGNVTSLTVGGIWKRNGDGANYETILHQSSNTSIGNSAYWFGYDLNNKVTATIGARQGVGWSAGQTNINADIGKWFYTVASWNGSTVSVWVNGILKVTYNLSTYTNPGTVTRLGASGDASGYLANGSIANIHINPNKAFTESEMLTNYYQAPIVTDGLVFAIDAGNLVSYENGSTTAYSLTGSNDGTLTNGVGFNSANGGTWEFDGVDDYITLPSSIATSLNGGEEASLNMWVKLNSNSNSVANTGIIQLSGYSNGNGNLYWYQNGYTYLDIFITTRYRVWINTVLDPRNWHMLTITTTPGTNGWKAYLNGILQYQTTGQSTVSVDSTIVGGLTLGENSSGRYTNGNIASCFIYDKALTADEVQQNFQAQSSRFI